ncbi:hypothetical protein K450DRAFT_219400 [Umbelopsis ramanniana AG]|uniref:DUF1640-domain-containing protein n=1 Tax=Umbelopsis ramanniana AG TaxID=1314678 RepID=A0AAD5EJ38_UMBRA|nr:uncharacterized protein K450DRAFT_219400 [Umbelopsis ramanniana AG]KAI8584347.1 hypothetical protein K450DRAFT_219400 [Umbelopsis ramanniana AG]
MTSAVYNPKHFHIARFSSTPSQSEHRAETIPTSLPNFDAVRFVSLLEKEGFSKNQAMAVVSALDDVVEESASIIKYSLISKADQELTINQYKADFSQLKRDIHEVEQTDVDNVKQANEYLKSEIEKLKKALSEEITRSHAGVRLDINLEKGRIRDEGLLLQDHLQHTDHRIESEIRALRKHMEGIKLQILQYMIGTITTAGTLLLAYKQLIE